MENEFWYPIIVFLAFLMIFAYAGQIIAGYVLSKSIRQIIFSIKNFARIWGTVFLIFILPLFFSVLASLPDLHAAFEEQSPANIFQCISSTNFVLSNFVLSMLVIFITLEISLIASHAKAVNQWRILLIIALVLDVCSGAIVTFAKVCFPSTFLIVSAIGFFAFVASFSIILFAKVSTEDYESN